MEWWLWFLLGFALLMIEMFTPGGFYFMFFGFGAFAVGAFGLLGLDIPLWVEWVMFTLVSLVGLATLRNKFVERYRPTGGKVDEDSLAGTEAFAQETIAPGAYGRVDSRGTVWRALNVGATTLHAGERCVISNVQGLLLEVKAPAVPAVIVT